jgi:hypothetical protein
MHDSQRQQAAWYGARTYPEDELGESKAGGYQYVPYRVPLRGKLHVPSFDVVN